MGHTSQSMPCRMRGKGFLRGQVCVSASVLSPALNRSLGKWDAAVSTSSWGLHSDLFHFVFWVTGCSTHDMDDMLHLIQNKGAREFFQEQDTLNLMCWSVWHCSDLDQEHDTTQVVGGLCVSTQSIFSSFREKRGWATVRWQELGSMWSQGHSSHLTTLGGLDEWSLVSCALEGSQHELDRGRALILLWWMI